MERLDKVISNYTKYSRSEVKEIIRAKKVKVNNEIVKKSDIKVDIKVDEITVNDEKIKIKKYFYLVLNKPKGYISATEDKKLPTVLDLISEEYKRRLPFPVGRLDKDTTGLMILTNDGIFAHNALSPRKDSKKIYSVTIDIPITEQMKEGFFNGVKLIDSTCKPAILEKTGEYTALVTLTEGKYHQIKRMFGCYKARVVELKRIQMGGFCLPKELKEGEYRELTEEELNKILNKDLKLD